MEVHKRGKHYLTIFGHHLALGYSGYGLVMNLTWLFLGSGLQPGLRGLKPGLRGIKVGLRGLMPGLRGL